MSSTLRYSFSLLLALGCIARLHAQAPDTVVRVPKPAVLPAGHQVRVSFDISKPAVNAVVRSHTSYEAALDYYLRREVYLVAEGGFGSATVDYPDLAYRSSGSFLRVGVDKCMLQRLFPKDWDAAFIGIRYGLGLIRRSEASYVVNDPLFGTTSGTIGAHNFTAHWAEITGGVRVELLKNLMAGWNVRARFMLNPGSFSELAPSFIAGYGKGDGSTAFDFNFYLCYALRWGMGKSAAAGAKQ